MPETPDNQNNLARMNSDELFDWICVNPNERHQAIPFLPEGVEIISLTPLAVNCFEYAFGIGEGYFPREEIATWNIPSEGQEGSIIVYYKVDWDLFTRSILEGKTVIPKLKNIEKLEMAIDYELVQEVFWRDHRSQVLPFTEPIHAGIVKEGGFIESQWGNLRTAPVMKHGLNQVPANYKVFGEPIVKYFERPS